MVSNGIGSVQNSTASDRFHLRTTAKYSEAPAPVVAPSRFDPAPRRAPERSTDIRDFLDALKSRWKTIALCTAVTTGLGIAYLAFTPTAYTATVSILVDSRPRAPVGSDPGSNINAQSDTILVESQVKILSSTAVLKRVVQREGLVDDPDFGGGGAGLRQRIMAMIGLGSKASADVDLTSGAVQALARAVVVKRSERTYVIDVEVSARDPAKAARLANSVADAYLADQLDARATVVRGDAKWLDQRIGELQARVQDAENHAQAYRAEHAITDANGKSVGDQELFDLANTLTQARARVIETKARWERFKSVVNSARINDLPADAARSGVLDRLRGQLADIERQDSNLRTTLGDRHPALREVENQLRDTKAQIVAELKRLADAAGVEHQVATDAEKELTARVEQARKATDGRNQSSVELREIERDVDSSKAVYEKFLRARETNDVQNTGGPDARIIAPATAPGAPSQPKTVAILFAAFASGLFVGVGLALLNDYLDDVGFATRALGEEDASEAGEVEVGERDGDDEWTMPSVDPFGARRRKTANVMNWITRARPDPAGPRASENSGPALKIRAPGGRETARPIIDIYESLIGEGRAPRRGVPFVALVTSLEDGIDITGLAVDLARHAAGEGKRALVIDAHVDCPSLGSLAPRDAKAALIDLNGVERPVYQAGPHLWFTPIAPNEDRIVARLGRRPGTERFAGIAGAFDFVAMAGPTLEYDEEIRELAAAADRTLVLASSDKRLPQTRDLARMLAVPGENVAGAVLARARERQAA